MKRVNIVSPQVECKRKRKLDEKHELKNDLFASLRSLIKLHVTDKRSVEEILLIVEGIVKYIKSIERSLNDSRLSNEELRRKRVNTQYQVQEEFLQ